jgi:c-di-GMP-binding flagellar brake protein YcgR
MEPSWLPLPGQLALVEVAGSDPLAGIVTQAGGDTVSIDLTGGEAPADAALSISFVAADALYRAHPSAVRRQSPRSLQVVVGEVERVQRRRTPRVRVQYPITVTSEKGEQFRGETLDVGIGGCRFATSHHIGEAQTAQLVIEMLEGAPIKAGGRLLETRHEEGEYEYRVAFSDIDDDAMARIGQLADDGT